MVDKKKIQELVEKYAGEVVAIRRDLHKYPEISNQEYRTSEYIQSRLKEMDILFKSGYAMTGIVGIIEGKHPDKKTIALRADMDALPIQEQTELSFRSEHPGIMHACGHDAHMAMLLGAARIIKESAPEFEGRVLLIFQPSEEKPPGGALPMIKEGALSDFPPDIIIAQHVMPELPAGTVGFCPGKYMASTDEFFITIKGQGGHAAMPDMLVDSVQIAAQLLVALQQVSSRMAPPGIPTVLSFGRIEAEGANNIIPEEVKLFGTFRTLDETWREQAHQKVIKLCKSLTESMGAECEIEILKGYPAVINDQEVTEKATSLARDYLGEGQVQKTDPQMTAEDFSYFAQEAPSTLFRLGSSSSDPERLKSEYEPLHSPKFNLDEETLKTGVGMLSWLCLSFLEED